MRFISKKAYTVALIIRALIEWKASEIFGFYAKPLGFGMKSSGINERRAAES